MTINDIKTRVDNERPNQYTSSQLIAWVNDVERDISMSLRPYEGIVTESSEQHDSLTDQVMLEEPDLYAEYVIARICLSDEEYDRYNIHAALYDERLTDWKERYIRAHRPISSGPVIL